MESSLHRALKERYGLESGGRSEVTLGGFRIDAMDGAGLLVEIQSGPLSPLRGKLARLLPDYRVRVVKPVVLERTVIRRTCAQGPDISARRSPKRGALMDIFDDLVALAKILQDANLAIEVLAVAVDEIRTPCRRRPGYRVVDRRLSQILQSRLLSEPDDLWQLLPTGHDWTVPFTSVDIAARTARPIDFAQRVAYCLRQSGAAQVVGKRSSFRVYRREADPARS